MMINFGTFVTVIQANNSSLPIPILFGPTLIKELETFFLRENLVNNYYYFVEYECTVHQDSNKE